MGDITLTPDMRVSEVAANYPVALKMFEAMKIDYCCGGQRTLQEAAEQAHLPLETVLAILHTAINTEAREPQTERNWHDAPLDELITHIVTVHHTYMHSELPRIEGMLERVNRAHGARHGNVLHPLTAAFQVLWVELESHLAKEESVTFPAIRRLLHGEYDEAARRTIAELEHEHDTAGKTLARMREHTHNYQTPADACTTFCALYEALEDMERDLHQHIHLENNILFPRVRQLVASRGEAA